tara:strand:+ start:252 stop:653 length:402 start_codon:yes stop_codon:yes gene_type:complete
MAVRKRDKKFLVEMEVTSIATQTMKGYITQQQLNKYMHDMDESYLRMELSSSWDTEFSEWEYDSLDLEQITIEGGPYKKDWCWLKGENLDEHPIVTEQKKRKLQRMSMIDVEMDKVAEEHRRLKALDLELDVP